MNDTRDLRRAFRSKGLKALFDQAVGLGWTPTMQGNGHMRLSPPDGGQPMTLSVSANGKGRTIQNSEAHLKRWLKENPQ